MRADRLARLLLALGMLLGTFGTGGTAVAQLETLIGTAAAGDKAKSPENQPDSAAPTPVPESLSNARATMRRFLQQTNHSDYTGGRRVPRPVGKGGRRLGRGATGVSI